MDYNDCIGVKVNTIMQQQGMMSVDDLMNDESILPIVIMGLGILAVQTLIYNRFLYCKAQANHQRDRTNHLFFRRQNDGK